MKTKYLLSFVLALWASALSAQAHWTFNYHEFQYSMTVYFELQANGSKVADVGNYEIAAFVGEECRGIATFETQTGLNGTTLSYGFIKVYSNVSSGETVTFKCYDKSGMEEQEVQVSAVSFVADDAIGLPSEPLAFGIDLGVLPGDVNNDGNVSSADVVALVKYILSDGTTEINEAAADVSGDGSISSADVVAIVRIILNN